MLALTIANLRMMARNRQTTFWALFFPLMLVVVFGIFDFDSPNSASLVVIDDSGTPSSKSLRDKLTQIELLALHEQLLDSTIARKMIADGELDYLIIIPSGFDQANRQSEDKSVTLVYNSTNQGRNQLIESTLQSLITENDADSQLPLQVISQRIQVPQTSYFNLVLMGLVGLGVMTNSIISIAVKISTYRNQCILRRLLITPLPIWKYFAAEITAHVILALVQAGIILAVGIYAFGGSVNGNIFWIFVVVAMGALVFLNVGFILSAWANTPAAASGMGNVVALPMLFFAGTFFSTANLPWLLPYLAEALPLTPMITGMREIALDSATLWDIWPQLATLAAWISVTTLAAVKVFRFS